MMTREEAIKWLEEIIQDTDTYWESCSEALQKELDEQKDVFNLALSALRPVSRKQVEKVWSGEWNQDELGRVVCNRCGSMAAIGTENALHNAKKYDRFCFYCGAPMTDEAVDMVMERLGALNDAVSTTT